MASEVVDRIAQGERQPRMQVPGAHRSMVPDPAALVRVDRLFPSSRMCLDCRVSGRRISVRQGGGHVRGG
jgi:hypothetical protein